MNLRNHLIPLVILLFSLSCVGLGSILAAQPEPVQQRMYQISIASGDVQRGTLSVRSSEDQPPYVAATPEPPIPSAIILPPPPPPQTGWVAGRIIGNGRLKWPLQGRINTYFNPGHQAIDIEAQCGTPVFSSMDGTITFAGWKNNGGGYVIEVAGADGFYLSYDHLSQIGVSSGQGVGTGQNIGASGTTGWSTGCHLHFGVYLYGVPVDPLLYL